MREVSYKDVTYTVCRPIQETTYKTVNYTVCRPIQETYKIVPVYTVCRPVQSVRYRCVPYTVQVPVHHTVMQCQPATEMVPVKQCLQAGALTLSAARFARPICRNAATRVQVPVKGTELRTTTYTVCRPGAVRPTLQECRYTVCKPVQTTSYKTVIQRPATRRVTGDGLVVSRARHVCPLHSHEALSFASYNEAVVQPLLRAGQDGLHQRLPLPVPRHVVVKTVCCPHRDRKRSLHQVYESAGDSQTGARDRLGKKVPYTVCEQIPVTTCQLVAQECVKQVPVTTCRLVSETCVKQVPVTGCE